LIKEKTENIKIIVNALTIIFWVEIWIMKNQESAMEWSGQGVGTWVKVEGPKVQGYRYGIFSGVGRVYSVLKENMSYLDTICSFLHATCRI
jgi:hypothetical protein